MGSALLAGVSGLRTHQEMLDVVGNNLANVNTTGFKAQRFRFADLLSDTKVPATDSVNGQVGGTNPMQVGLGVKAAAIDTDLKQGSFETTGRDLDMAIQGNGYFVVNNGSDDLFTRAGAFSVDKDNTLVDPATGFRVQRFGLVGEGDLNTPAIQVPGDNSIKIPFGMSIPGKVTESVTVKGNLSAAAVGPLAETLTSNQPFTAGGSAATAATALNALDSNLAPYANGDVLNISGTDANGAAVSTTFTYGTDGTTLGSLMSRVGSAFTQATASLDASGNLVLKANNTGPANLTLSISDAGTNTGSTSFTTHSARPTIDGKDGDTVKSAIQVFDPQGTSHNLSLTFQKVGNNQWNMTAAINPSEGTVVDGQVDSILFNDDGSFRQAGGTGAGDGDILLNFNGFSAPQSIRLSFGNSNGFDGVTQFGGGTSAAATDQDGYASGFLTGVSVSQDGIIGGIFTNGRILPVAQIAVAEFTNPGGLNRLGDNYFGLSNNSGLAVVSTALSGGKGSVRSGSLESSNVDVALEFTRLIIAQRGFQVNARTITAANEVLQELGSIIR